MFRRTRAFAVLVKREFLVYREVAKHPRTPRLARILFGAAISYACLPIDIIPDFIPVIGHIDDAIIIPTLIWLALRMVPKGVVGECRAKVVSK